MAVYVCMESTKCSSEKGSREIFLRCWGVKDKNSIQDCVLSASHCTLFFHRSDLFNAPEYAELSYLHGKQAAFSVIQKPLFWQTVVETSDFFGCYYIVQGFLQECVYFYVRREIETFTTSCFYYGVLLTSLFSLNLFTTLFTTKIDMNVKEPAESPHLSTIPYALCFLSAHLFVTPKLPKGLSHSKIEQHIRCRGG